MESCCCPAVNFSSNCYSDLHVLINLTHKYELAYHICFTLVVNGILHCSVAYKSYRYHQLGGTQSQWRPPTLMNRRPCYMTKTATESSALSLVSSLPYVYSVNLCRHLPNHSRNARINSPKYVPFCFLFYTQFYTVHQAAHSNSSWRQILGVSYHSLSIHITLHY